MFKQVQGSVSFPELESRIGEFWRERKIYHKSLAARAGCEKFVFYEGPPTANGMPHPGHCLTRAIKDLFPRYRTMRGYLCERKAGWDTHGLPVEVEVCKELGIHSKEEIEEYGVEPFIHKCQESVWRYMQQWQQVTERLGFWIDLDEAYVTYHQSYVESVWWALKSFFERDLLYQGHKIVWWWAQGGTALSSGEVGQGYREVADPSVYVRFPLLDEPDTALLVWTTTPWTLPSNQFAAVDADLEYAVVRDEESGQQLILAAALVETIATKVKRELPVVATLKGRDLVGRRYRPPFDYYYAADGEKTGRLTGGDSESVAWRVVAADFVTTESGTGVVHQAPAFGEVDYDVLVAEQARFVEGEGPQLINAVASDGTFTAEALDYQGRWVKEADKDITRNLRDRGLLYHLEQYLHDYPFCWRADEDPLIQYPRESWFIRTTAFKEQMLENNRQINWLPDHIRDGRFGNFLETNVDWALSRERFWGTPLPIWVCEETGRKEAIASYEELLAKPGVDGVQAWESAKQARPELPEDLKVHKPYIDEITYDSPFAAGARMRRVPEVIDCWFDSGAMPFAQWGYPHTGESDFGSQFPADFISEALDQTRGWFYSLLAISTLLFDKQGASDSQSGGQAAAPPALPHPYRNCIVLGLMLGEDGTKMAKSKRNYREPGEIFDLHGADALRWYFFAKQPPWSSIIYSEQAIKESIPEFLLRLWNVYSFFVIYANIDGFDPSELIAGQVDQLDSATLSTAAGYRTVAQRSELDRWILSELQRTAGVVIECMDRYDNFAACTAITDCVDSLSNWYLRRARPRFWANDKTAPEKLDAYWTTYECLTTLSKLIAPFVPFLAEELWQNLAAGIFAERARESVHLCDYPKPNAELLDEQLSQGMSLGREISSLGRAARMNAKLKVRQPLAKVEIVLASDEHRDWLESHGALICEELNVKSLEFTSEPEKYIDYQVQPDFKRLGPRVGKQMPAVKKALGEADGATLLAQLKRDGKVELALGDETVELSDEDIQVRLQAKEGWSAAQGQQCVVVLDTELTPELLAEGIARDLVRVIQDQRKEMGCEFTDRIEVGIETNAAEIRAAVDTFLAYITQETLAVELKLGPLEGVEPIEISVGSERVRVYVRRAAS
ncbi:MAG: isoleucine--tRNA ligase [Planctomycetota bacterium]|nr:MAG: isoleucine--tRNA ligase [Planctomycetota bacterium]REJ89301.1 MAG: isoleucine--tRNA ligase [Planctomycetota bacterium]